MRGVHPEGLISRAPQVTGDAFPMVKLFHRFLKDDYGGSSIQYAFIAVVIPVTFIVSVNCLGPKSNTTVSTLGSVAFSLAHVLK